MLLVNRTGSQSRTFSSSSISECYVRYHEKIVQMIKSEPVFESQGGLIILSQIENEYVPESKALGTVGHSYMDCAYCELNLRKQFARYSLIGLMEHINNRPPLATTEKVLQFVWNKVESGSNAILSPNEDGEAAAAELLQAGEGDAQQCISRNMARRRPQPSDLFTSLC